MSSDGKESTCNVGNPGFLPWSGRSPKKGMVTSSSILARRISWTEEPVELQSKGLERVRHDWEISTFTFFTLWVRKLMASHSGWRTSSPPHSFITHVVPKRRRSMDLLQQRRTQNPSSNCFSHESYQLSASVILDENPWTFHITYLSFCCAFFSWYSPFFPFSLSPLFYISWSFSVHYSICSIIKTYTKRNI